MGYVLYRPLVLGRLRTTSTSFINTKGWVNPTVHVSNKLTAVKPLKKGHFGDNINSAVLSLVERLSLDFLDVWKLYGQ